MGEVVFSEHSEQVELMRWTRETATLAQYPDASWLFAIPNGAKLPYTGKGKNRYSKQAMILKSEGLQPGVPDLCLPVAAGGYHGLFVELKSLRKGAKVSPEQAVWIAKLKEFGYQVDVCFGWEAARDAIKGYLELKRTDPSSC